MGLVFYFAILKLFTGTHTNTDRQRVLSLLLR